MWQIRADTYLKIILHIIFLISGVATVLIGQVLPILARQFALNDLETSYFFPAQFSGSLLGTFLAGRFALRGDQIMATVVGAFSMTFGLLLMNVGVLQFCLLGFFINGIGIGMTLPSINMAVVAMEPSRSGAALSILNLCWGVGAILSKPFVDAFSAKDAVGLTTIILAAALFLPTLLLTRTNRSNPSLSNQIDGDPDLSIWAFPLAWLIALFNFIHVGFESGIGGWLTTYSERIKGDTQTGFLSPTLLYFSFFVIGRGIAPLLFKRLDETKMLFSGLGIVLIGVVIILVAKDLKILSIGALIVGFGTSWIFPANVARFSRTFGQAAIRKATPLFICGTLGAMFTTWLIGYVSEASGNLSHGLLVLLVSIVSLIALQTVLSVLQGKKFTSREAS